MMINGGDKGGDKVSSCDKVKKGHKFVVSCLSFQED